jgi:hypothetical protein
MTWVAIVFDLIHKIKEMDLHGDTQANEELKKIEKFTKEHLVKESQLFENSLIDLLQKKFELISAQEAIDIQRLYDDRNRCAHPSMTDGTEVFKPSKETARYHLTRASEIVLSQPPRQGKKAIEIAENDINSTMTTDELNVIKNYLRGNLLHRSKESLERNWLRVCIKNIVKHNKRHKWPNTLEANIQLVNIPPSDVVETLNTLLYGIDEERIPYVFIVLSIIEDLWEKLNITDKTKLSAFIDQVADKELVWGLQYAEKVPQLSERVFNKLAVIKHDLLIHCFPQKPTNKILDLIADRYEKSSNYAEACDIAKGLFFDRMHAYSKEQQERILLSGLLNKQVGESSYYPKVKEIIAQDGKLTHDEISQIESKITSS